jgi:hypothetical protein
MAVTGKSKSGEAGRKTLIARADARALLLAPIVADIRASGITSWYGISEFTNHLAASHFVCSFCFPVLERLKTGVKATKFGIIKMARRQWYKIVAGRLSLCFQRYWNE